MSQIDFVVLWVDDTDEKWRQEMVRYCTKEQSNGLDANRYRDWGIMKYWFRGVEKYAPWVNRIFFVTSGHLPPWLNQDHPKLRIVNHQEYIPEQYLPTFNSNVIELWLHQIPDLGRKFVLFNDDMFLTSPVQPTDFFKGDFPCEAVLLDMVTAPNLEDCLPHMQINNFALINKHFNKKDVVRDNFSKFFSPLYGKDLLRNMLLMFFQYFSCFRDSHLPTSYIKDTFFRVWQEEGEALEACGCNRFRSKTDLTHWLMKCWQICEGNFAVRSTGWGHHYELWEDDIDEICQSLESQKYHAVCLNDSKAEIEFHKIRERLIRSFECIMPDQSDFEQETGPKEEEYEI